MTTRTRSSLGLGRGLEALIPVKPLLPESARELPPDDGVSVGIVMVVEIAKIRSNPYQPRQDFDQKSLEELARSIKEHGLIQPITVRRAESGFELIAGERRVRACMEAGLERIPAYILDIAKDTELLEIALIENVQRENLNPIEVARGYQRLMEECHLTQEEIALKVGKDRTTIANFVRLLRLPEIIQQALRQRELTMGHARAILALPTEEQQGALFREVLAKQLSVRQTEALVREIERGRVRISPDGKLERVSKPSIDKNPKGPLLDNSVRTTLREIENHLQQLLGTRVRLNANTRGQGRLEVEFYSFEELERL
ncbi:MAG: ParB/RepB/Spo0J family partition protein, partial [Candidatus Kapabacteria bacterium]|nr:ParB/RepB/Spo0J family partition protein [Candidatus Kapabacteria bacterium]